MAMIGDKFKEIKKATPPRYKVPKSVQQLVEIEKVSENGIFQVGKNRFSKAYRFGDVNYVTTGTEEQVMKLYKYGTLLNSLGVDFKFCIMNLPTDKENFEKNILFDTKDDYFDEYRDAYNQVIREKSEEGSQGIEQKKYLIIMIERKNFEEAKAFFATLEATLHKAFNELGSYIEHCNGDERLNLIHKVFHMNSNVKYSFHLKEYKQTGRDFRNDLVNSYFKFEEKHFKTEYGYGKAFYLKSYPNGLKDSFLNELCKLPVYMTTSIDVVPIPKDITLKTLQKKYMGIESDIIKQQRTRNKNNDFSSQISYKKRTEKAEIEQMMTDVQDNDQCLFFVGLTIVVYAKSLEEIESIEETMRTIAGGASCQLEVYNLRQREAFNSALPIGVRQIDTMRTLMTRGLAALMPFFVQELNEKDGIYYGINQISKKLNIGNRKKLVNGNGFVFGVPGSGKSFFCKQGMGEVFLKTNDDIIVIDPQNEYFDIARKFRGAVVNLSRYTNNFINPLEVNVNDLDIADSKGIISEKGEFMLSLCAQCMGPELGPKHKSIIDRCVQQLYFSILHSDHRQVPLMEDFYKILKQQTDPEARDIALSLELFISGSLNIFNHHTNVDVDNRFIVYGIRDLGSDLASVAMLSMMENISGRIAKNAAKGRATWLYIDEFHVLLDKEYSAKYLQGLWKKVRKQGGLCTGITQNVTDLLNSYTATTMLSNSEFVVLLRQSPTDLGKMTEVINVSKSELEYAINSEKGKGLLKHGTVVVPFDNQIDKDSMLYQMYNTNLHEMQKKCPV